MAWFLLLCGGCGNSVALVLPNENTDPVDPAQFHLLARFAHISDAHVVDEESPARLTVAAEFSRSAWRPQEAYAVHLLDGMVRTINKMHAAVDRIDFVLHTGDATDNAQQNELNWFLTVFDGGEIDPLSGTDDRLPDDRPDPLLDPHHPFTAQGLYRQGDHGPLPTITWYNVVGNHDRFAVGVFPIVDDPLTGRRFAPLPLPDRLPIFFPVLLDPLSDFTIGLISPAHPGPPPDVNFPLRVTPNPQRRYFTSEEYVRMHFTGRSEPLGHGFDSSNERRTWYSVSPVPGLRLIGLDTARPLFIQPAQPYSEGSISLPQVRFLRRELKRAEERGEIVIVATHHPSDSLQPVYGSALTPTAFRRLLRGSPAVILHLAGHWHTNVVIDRTGYTEIVTGSVLDPPQQGRVIEIWCREHTAEAKDCTVRYRLFSHLDDIPPPSPAEADLFDDPYRPLRRTAAELAAGPPQ